MGKEAEIDIVFFPSGEIRSVSSNMINAIIQREQNIDSIGLQQKTLERNLLDIRWNSKFNEWSISDFKLKLFIELTENRFKHLL